jgi:NAD(P)-dependent dehydrogenase (short-subunit alcohol dehydrogenase family)
VRTGWREPATRPALEALLDTVSADLDGLDLVAHMDASDGARSAATSTLTEAQWAEACEATSTAPTASPAAHAHLAPTNGRLVYVVPTIAMAGAAGYAPYAAAAEGIRALAKGIAKTWGKDGITVNTIAVAAAHVFGPGVGDEVATALSLSPPALGRIGDPAGDLAPVLSLSQHRRAVQTGSMVLDRRRLMALGRGNEPVVGRRTAIVTGGKASAKASRVAAAGLTWSWRRAERRPASWRPRRSARRAAPRVPPCDVAR